MTSIIKSRKVTLVINLSIIDSLIIASEFFLSGPTVQWPQVPCGSFEKTTSTPGAVS